MKRIGFVTDELYPFSAGGIGRLIHNLIADSIERDDDVEFHVFIPSRIAIDGAAVRALFGRRVWAHYFDSAPKAEPDSVYPRETDFSHSMRHLESLAIAQTLEESERQFGAFDVIEFPDFRGWAFCALQQRRLGRAFQHSEITVRLHSTLGIIDRFEGWAPWGEQLAWHELERKALRDADRVIAHLPCIAEYNQQFYGFDDEWMRKVVVEFPPMGISSSPPEEANRPEHILFVSKIQRFKRPELFARGAAMFMHEREDFTGNAVFACHLFDQTLWQKIRDQIAGPQRERFVHVSVGAERERLISRSIVVLPSDYESLCLSAYEASAAGATVVLNEQCLAFGDRTPWVDGTNCYKFDGTAKGLASALSRAWDSPHLSPVEVPTHERYWGQDSRAASGIPKVSIVRERPRVSVIVRNEAGLGHLSETLLSIATSSYDDVDVIVADDCSRAPLDEAMLASAERHGGVRIVRPSAPCGPSALLNEAVAQCDGRVVLVARAGDLLGQRLITDGVAAIEGGQSDVVVPQLAILDGIEAVATREYLACWIYLGDVPSLGMIENRILGPVALFRRDVLRRHRFDESLETDFLWELGLRLVHAGAQFTVTNDVQACTLLDTEELRGSASDRRGTETWGRILAGLPRPLPRSVTPYAFALPKQEVEVRVAEPSGESAPPLRHRVVDEIDMALKRLPYVQPALRELTLRLARLRRT